MGEASQTEELQHKGPDCGIWGAESSRLLGGEKAEITVSLQALLP